MKTMKIHFGKINSARRITLILFVLLLSGCLGQTEPSPAVSSSTPNHPVTPGAVLPTSAPTTLPTAEVASIPTGLIRIPVPEFANETANALLTAEHIPVDYYRLARELKGIQPGALTPEALTSNYKVNDRSNFYINANLAGDYESIPVRLRYISQHAYWWSSTSARASDSDIEAAAKNFEDEVYKIDHLIFGTEASPGIDNDRRIHIFLVREERWGGYFGYYSNSDEYPTAIFPYSNQKEMIVLNLGGVQVGSPSFSGEMAHELQHMIHWNLDPNEDLWLNEAMGELAIFLSGAPETSSALGPTNAELFAMHPEIQLTSRPETSSGDNDEAAFAHYGAERLFAVYLLEQFGPKFIQGLVQNPAPGVISIQQELDKLQGSPRFNDVFASWLVANLLDRPDIEQGQYGYKEMNPPAPLVEEINSFRGQKIDNRLPPYGARYYELDSTKPVDVSFTGSTLARLTPVDPPSGQYAWYSNRGDGTEFTLTRSFDLTNLHSATLNYKIWYELEELFDWAYLEVSTDGSNSWKILATPNTTDLNPKDTSYGPGYTGAVIDWIPESIDLSDYAGQKIQIRFHVITDFTTNRDGIQVDDIEIPELGYFDGAEDDSGGWEAHGFIRSANVVPAKWMMWLLLYRSPLEIHWVDLNVDQTAEFEIQGFSSDYPYAGLVIAPAAPVTTMELPYELVFQNP